MTNSIWNTDCLREASTKKLILYFAGGSRIPYTGWNHPDIMMLSASNESWWNYTDVMRWCYVDDIIAQADRAERLQKIAERQNEILQDNFATLGYYIGKEVMDMSDEIKQLIKGEIDEN